MPKIIFTAQSHLLYILAQYPILKFIIYRKYAHFLFAFAKCPFFHFNGIKFLGFGAPRRKAKFDIMNPSKPPLVAAGPHLDN